MGDAFFDKDMVGIEIECASQGKPNCVFKVKEKNKWNLKEKIVKEQFPHEVINKKMLSEKMDLKIFLTSK